MTTDYDLHAKQYNTTRKADPYLAERLYDKLDPQADEIYLDLGCGSGNYTHSLLGKDVNILGLDPSKEMLAIAASKGYPGNWTQGRAEAIPFPEDHFNGGIVFLTIHHWQDLEQGFAELFRVCKKGSRIILFSSCKEQMKNYWLNHYFPKMMEASIEQMPSFIEILEAILYSGIKVYHRDNYSIKDDLEDKFLYCGKNDPEKYFDAEIRKGISSFSSLSHQDEVDNGLKKLRKDIESGSFESIRRANESEEGDYFFLTLFK